MNYSASISSCGKYRWNLARVWGTGSRAVFVLLNPSTADAHIDDPTLRRCISFAKRESCGSLTVVNLFALRATNPDLLLKADDPVGAENAHYIVEAIESADVIICGWGSKKIAEYESSKFVEKYGHRKLNCLARTKSGAPKHPLYVRGDAELLSYP